MEKVKEEQKSLEELLKERNDKELQEFNDYIADGCKKYNCEIIPKVSILGNQVVSEILIRHK